MPGRRILGAVAMSTAAAAAVAITLPALAGTEDTARPTSPATAATGPDSSATNLLATIQRDLKIDGAEARALLDAQAELHGLDSKLRSAAGKSFGGSWLDGDKLVVGVTDDKKAAAVRSLGGEARVVKRSADELNAAQQTLDSKAPAAPGKVAGWYVNPERNQITVLARKGSEGAARAFARSAGMAADAVNVQTVADDFTAFADVRGGDPYMINGASLCSVGFPVTTGFVSAGHCGQTGSSTIGIGNTAQGTFRTSTIGKDDGNDYAVIDVNSNWTPRPAVHTTGGDVAIAGSTPAAVGAAVCRTGTTTGTHCGEITSFNVSISVDRKLMKGFILTTACAEPGDSGGPLMAGNQAQGVLSGGTGDCDPRTPGTPSTVYQPINPVLSAQGLTLVTTTGGVQPASTTAAPAATTPAPAPTTAAPGGGLSTLEDQVVTLVNQERAKTGCSALAVDNRLTTAARGHSKYMATTGVMSHFEGDVDPGERIRAAGYNYSRYGENIAYGQTTAASVMNGWMNSPGHRANILNCEFKDIGVGLVYQGSTPWWTQNFGAQQ